MTIRLFAIAAGAVVALGTPAAAQNWYGQINAGANVSGEVDIDASLTDGTDTISDSGSFDLDRGLFLSGAIGRDNGRFRVEGEVLYTRSDVEDTVLQDGSDEYDLGDIETTQAAVMLNVLVDLGSGGRVTPYIGAGIGFGATRFEAPELDEDEVKTGLTWQLKAGVAFAISDRVTFDLGYRYLRGPTFEVDYNEAGFGYSLEAEPTSHVVTAGIRFAF
ncbi:outer membrane protein [Brevundimonas sp.]|uniref:outer membrane protein n=1 Tax=Brevundimonas sp. TaxID=1871086 RepID=UPI003919B061